MLPIIALDFQTLSETEAFLDQFPVDEPLVVKIGMELFYGEGPKILASLRRNRQLDIFLDLKLHDIPHTVERAAIQIGRLGVQLTTVHAAGGSAMIEAAKRGLIEGAKQAGVKPAKLLAITQLTSTSQAILNDELGIEGTVMASVKHLASLAETSGADGVVASALEAPAIREEVADDFLIVTPGIRPQNSAVGDQVRVTTPDQAKALGSSAIVVGRPITQAADAPAAYQQILQQWR